MKNQDHVAEQQDVNSVTYTDFKKSTSEWKGARMASNGMLGSIILPNHFEIPLDDLAQLLEEAKHNSVSVRAFIGLEYYGEYEKLPHTSEMKLFLTGVNEDGNPIYHGTEGESKIYDFITPCPPTC